MPAPLPRGLRFFPSDAPRAYRRRRLFIAALLLVALAALIWPVFSLLAGPRPLFLGLPLPFAWVIGWLLIVFAAFVWLYRTEAPD